MSNEGSLYESFLYIKKTSNKWMTKKINNIKRIMIRKQIKIKKIQFLKYNNI